MLRRSLAALLIALPVGTALAQAARNPPFPNPSFNVVNRTSNPINELYASSSGATNWGQDRLGERTISPGGNFPVRLPADGTCTYDIRVVYANGTSDEQRGINTCNLDNVIFPATGGRPTPSGRRDRAAADDPSFRLVNRGRSEVNELYASLPTDEDWGEDRLGTGTVAAGTSKVIRLPNGQCVYDVRIVYANGEATEKRRVNLCAIADMRVP